MYDAACLSGILGKSRVIAAEAGAIGARSKKSPRSSSSRSSTSWRHTRRIGFEFLVMLEFLSLVLVSVPQLQAAYRPSTA